MEIMEIYLVVDETENVFKKCIQDIFTKFEDLKKDIHIDPLQGYSVFKITINKKYPGDFILEWIDMKEHCK